jgi:hypothetical protein
VGASGRSRSAGSALERTPHVGLLSSAGAWRAGKLHPLQPHQPEANLTTLPSVVLATILSFAEERDVAATLSLVSRSVRALTRSDDVWFTYYGRRWSQRPPPTNVLKAYVGRCVVPMPGDEVHVSKAATRAETVSYLPAQPVTGFESVAE